MHVPLLSDLDEIKYRNTSNVTASSSSLQLSMLGLASLIVDLSEEEKHDLANSFLLVNSLMLCKTKKDFALSYKNIDWSKCENAANILFLSENESAIASVPLNWLDLKVKDLNLVSPNFANKLRMYEDEIKNPLSVSASKKRLWFVEQVLKYPPANSNSLNKKSEDKKLSTASSFISFLLNEGKITADSLIDGYMIDHNKSGMSFMDLAITTPISKNADLINKLISQKTWNKESSKQTLVSLASAILSSQDFIDSKLAGSIVKFCLSQNPSWGESIKIKKPKSPSSSSKIDVSLASVWFHIINSEKALKDNETWVKSIKKSLSGYALSLDKEKKEKLFKEIVSFQNNKNNLRLFSTKNNFTDFTLPLFYDQEKEIEKYVFKSFNSVFSDDIPPPSSPLDFNLLDFNGKEVPVAMGLSKARFICKKAVDSIFSNNDAGNNLRTLHSHLHVDRIKKILLPGLMQVCDKDAAKFVDSLINILEEENKSKKSLLAFIHIEDKPDRPKKSKRKI